MYLDQFFHQLTGSGANPKIVFLHGLMGFGNNWRKIISHFEDEFHCLSFDQRGHGRSFKPPSGYSPEDYAQDLKHILDDLGWDKINLVGHSMGGRNALSFAHMYPQYINKLIIVDISPEMDPHGVAYYENLIMSIPTPFLSREDLKAYFREEFIRTSATREKAEVLAAYFSANIVEQPDGSWDWRFYRDGIIQSLYDGRIRNRWFEVSELKSPTLWVRGELSKDLEDKTFKEILASNQNIQGVTISGAGHWVHADQPLLFVENLKTFLSS